MKKSNYFVRIGDGLSQLLNVIVFNGLANESVSGRSYREKWALEQYIDFVFGKGHCKQSHEHDLRYSEWLLSNNGKI